MELTVEQQLANAQAELLRLRVGLAKGLTPTQADRLRGDTEGAVTADADAMLREFVPSTPSRPPTRTGTDAGGGGGGMEAGAALYRARHGDTSEGRMPVSRMQ